MSLEDLEQHVEKVVVELNQRLDDLSKRMEDRFASGNGSLSGKKMPRRNRSASFWGVALVTIGVILLGNHFNWFDLDIPIVPVALIILGCYLILENR